ncbi:MAG: hypothetical protein LBM06_03430 [Prevotellaceae bacterium]|jgi:hypothetical protein|nr:hypothetical protein [Prevotellaceae bacterium]
MTEEEKKRLSTFEGRLRRLVDSYDEVKRKYSETSQLLTVKQKELEQMRIEQKNLKASYTNLANALTLRLTSSDVEETKLQLTLLVREVDKCIASLLHN